MRIVRLKTRQRRNIDYGQPALRFNIRIPQGMGDYADGPLINAISSNGFQWPSYCFSTIAGLGDDAGEETDGWCIDRGNSWEPRINVSGETHRAIVAEGLKILDSFGVPPFRLETEMETTL